MNVREAEEIFGKEKVMLLWESPWMNEALWQLDEEGELDIPYNDWILGIHLLENERKNQM